MQHAAFRHVFAAGNYEESLKLLADGVIAESVKAKIERLAIIDFTDAKGVVTPMGQFLAEELGKRMRGLGREVAQVLVTRVDLDDRERFLNARHTLLELLRLGVVPS